MVDGQDSDRRTAGLAAADQDTLSDNHGDDGVNGGGAIDTLDHSTVGEIFG
jgi:hypothetical protein